MSGPSVSYSRALGYQICAAYRLSHVALNAAIAASRFRALSYCEALASFPLVKFETPKPEAIFGNASIGIKDAPRHNDRRRERCSIVRV